MGEFGLTPSSRVKLGTKAEAPKDDLEAFFASEGA
jgi:phage terminase small subunit